MYLVMMSLHLTKRVLGTCFFSKNDFAWEVVYLKKCYSCQYVKFTPFLMYLMQFIGASNITLLYMQLEILRSKNVLIENEAIPPLKVLYYSLRCVRSLIVWLLVTFSNVKGSLWCVLLTASQINVLNVSELVHKICTLTNEYKTVRYQT